MSWLIWGLFSLLTASFFKIYDFVSFTANMSEARDSISVGDSEPSLSIWNINLSLIISTVIASVLAVFFACTA